MHLSFRQNPLCCVCFTWWRICPKSSLEKITLLLKMFKNHWCIKSMHNGLKSQTGLGDQTSTQPLDLGKPQDLPQSPTPHVGKGNRARHRRMNGAWPGRDSVDAGLLLVSLAYPSQGPRTSMAGVTCLTSYPRVTLVEGSFLGVKVDAKMGSSSCPHSCFHSYYGGWKQGFLINVDPT